MTVANIARKSGPFIGDGIIRTFPYNFRVLTATEIAVFQNDTEVNQALYTVNGVGADSGSITLTTAPAVSDTVWIFGDTIKQQPTSYPEQGPFPAVSHETGLDRPMMTLWEFEETLERIPTFKQPTLPALRSMELPQPDALKLYSWNANGDGITYVDSTILTVTPLPGAGARVEAQATVAVNASASQGVLTASNLVPAGALLQAVLTHNSIAFGTSNGLTGYSLGTLSAPERYGRSISVALNGENSAGMFRNYAEEPAPASLDITLSAEGGVFDATGQAIVTVVYNVFVPPTAVP